MYSPTGRSRKRQPPVQSIKPDSIHPKDRDLPGFTHDSHGNPKTGYHDPSSGGTYSVDTGMVDAFMSAAYGSERARELKQRERRNERVNHAGRIVLNVGCLVISAALIIAILLGLAVLIKLLWGLL